MDYPEEVEIEWYTLGGTKLLSEVFYPDALVFTCNCPVQNYDKVIIKITKTRYPQCYARLQYILYGLYCSIIIGTATIIPKFVDESGFVFRRCSVNVPSFRFGKISL